MFCVAGGPNKKSCTNSGDTPVISMHCFPTDPSLRNNGYGLFEDIDMISTPQNIRQEYGCVQRILMRAASQSVSQAILKASITVTQSVS